MTRTGTQQTSASATPQAWYAIAILTLAYIFSYIDRSILSLLVGPIRNDLNLSDTEFSLLHGLAFAIFYTLMGVPIARLADSRNRKTVIAIGVAAWSLMTAACGLARNFTQLFIARMGVGVGEAALSPAAYSMISDLFPKEKLGRALGLYSSGVFLGIGLSFLIGGTVIDILSKSDTHVWPVIGAVAPWQATFFLVGLPGLLVALLVLTIREPARLTMPGETHSQLPFRTVIAFFREHSTLYLLHFFGFSMLTLLFNAIMSWAPEYFIRIHGMNRAEVGTYLGLIVMIFGGAGIYCGGLTSDWLIRKGQSAAPIRAGFYGAVALIPLAGITTLIPNPWLSLALFCPLLFFASFPFSPAVTAIQLVTPGPMRAQISAVYLFVVNLTGIGMGATVTALVTDFVFADDMKLHISMAMVGAMGAVVSSLILWLAIKPFDTRFRNVHGG